MNPKPLNCGYSPKSLKNYLKFFPLYPLPWPPPKVASLFTLGLRGLRASSILSVPMATGATFSFAYLSSERVIPSESGPTVRTASPNLGVTFSDSYKSRRTGRDLLVLRSRIPISGTRVLLAQWQSDKRFPRSAFGLARNDGSAKLVP